MIVFPAIDLRGGQCVRLRQGRAADETVYDEDPAAVARRWAAQGARWLHVVDLDAALGEPAVEARLWKSSPGPAGSSREGESPPIPQDTPTSETSKVFSLNLQRLAEIRAAVPQVSIQFGGGLRTLEAIEAALALGADRVVLGTAAVHRPDLVAEALRRFRAESIVAGIDARQGLVATHGWQQTSRVTAVELGRAVRRLGVVRAVYTDVARDGMLSGAAVEATAALARATGLRTIASGGVASPDDVARLRARAGDGIEGVIIGQALYRGTVSLPEALRVARGP